MKNTGNKREFFYPIGFIENLNRFPFNCVLPCSVIFMDEKVGGLLLICKKRDVKYIGLIPPNDPNPFHRFRMLNIDQRIYAIEVHLTFDQDKTIKMHLNPVARSTMEFFKLVIDSKRIAFHFYDAQSISLSSGVTELNGEDIEWVKRNYSLMKKLKNNADYELICKQLIQAFDPKDIHFKFFDNEAVDCFIRPDKLVAKFEY